MCGIIGYIGNKQALPILLSGLRRLEYRGYDSAGIVIGELGNREIGKFVDEMSCTRVRSVGKIDMLAEKLKERNISGTVGIAHTRWATHGGVTEANAHPHTDAEGRFMVVHNGIIENYRALKEELSGSFQSETDSEVLAHLIASYFSGNLEAAVAKALSRVRGTYGIVVLDTRQPETLVAARSGSPIVIGIGDGEYYVASDATPIVAHTKKVIYLDDGEIAEITRTSLTTRTIRHEHVVKCVEEIEWDEAQAQLGGYPHFMLKEIYEQPSTILDAIRGRYDLSEGMPHLGGMNMTEDEMRKVNRVMFIACGTAMHAALIGKYAFERLAGIPTEVDISSEFRYRDPVIDEHTLVFAVSQSGETADTLAAIREAKRRGAFVRGIVNVIGSTIARETDGGTYIHAGPELAVASTKAYMNMIAVIILYALRFGRTRRASLATGERLLRALLEIPDKMKRVLEQSSAIESIAKTFARYEHMYFLGRGINVPVACEGSLKLKEISYIHSEAYAAGEMKHGPISLLAPNFPVLGIMTKNSLYDKTRGSLEEARARKAPLIVVATDGDESARELTPYIMYVPPTMELLEPLLNTIPLQLFAYHAAVSLGRDVDRPRNLAKSVTVE